MSGPCEWACEAYGPDGRQFGALCFIAGEAGERVCASAGMCHLVMAAERRRVFQRIQERAAEGDEDARYLAEIFTSPDQLLGGAE